MKRQQIFEGAIVYIQGHEFVVKNLRFIVINDKPTARFEGICTKSSRNASIRNTGYDGATYGGNDRVYDFTFAEGREKQLAEYRDMLKKQDTKKSMEAGGAFPIAK